MNKQLSTAFLIIFSILVLALKDSASFVHAILHYIPNNPWHQHDEISKHHHLRINPLEIHKYFQNKHSHQHNEHTHAHDVMDHIHHDEHQSNSSSPSEKINLELKVDYYFQSLANFHLSQSIALSKLNHFSIYLQFIHNRDAKPPYQPPQV
ncbi:hypothetical protein [Cytophaga aurantiaca]|uniref:hypothetical protein n=1 Tax=Cytophaga aurantiaca TaxID=29530 RepID=UPI000376C9EE|nr:hypothetical protein [Cytophaga aurantiaca]